MQAALLSLLPTKAFLLTLLWFSRIPDLRHREYWQRSGSRIQEAVSFTAVPQEQQWPRQMATQVTRKAWDAGRLKKTVKVSFRPSSPLDGDYLLDLQRAKNLRRGKTI
jgi:hypothetical protein